MVENENKYNIESFDIDRLDSTVWLFNTQVRSLENDPLWAYLRKYPRLKRILTRWIATISALLKGEFKREKKKYRRAQKNAAIIASSPLFDAKWYSQHYFDVAYSGYSPEMHYALYGKDGRFPSRIFDARRYQRTYKDVASSDFNPLVHYELHGKAEERAYTRVEVLPIPESTIEVAQDTDEQLLYNNWQEHVEKVQVRSLPANTLTHSEFVASLLDSDRTKFSIIVRTHNTPILFLEACVNSVSQQAWRSWQLCIVDDASTNPETIAYLRMLAETEYKVDVVFRKEAGGIAACNNAALEIAEGEYIMLLDHTDMLAATALQEIALLLPTSPGAAIIYSDEDQINEDGVRCHPFFKPDFSPDLLYSQNYIGRFAVYKESLIKSIGGFRAGIDGSQHYDLLLRAIATLGSKEQVVHIPKILYHSRVYTDQMTEHASHTDVQVLQHHFDSQQLQATATIIKDGMYRVHWPIPANQPLVSLIIPTRDGYADLKKCIDSILDKTTYKNFEILVIDNQSSDPQTLAYFTALNASAVVRVYSYNRPFNYSSINNFGVKHAKGSIIGLINNDIEVIEPDWLSEMVSHAIRPEIGCVGAKLLYPDGTIQHGGVIVGIGGVASHSHKHFDGQAEGYHGRMRIVHNVSAVTAATLLVRKSIFEEVGGLDEDTLPVAFNDVDFCLKVHTAGYRNLWTPFAVLTHFESKSRGLDESPAKRARFLNECKLIKTRWRHLVQNDPYYNPNLTRAKEDYSIIEA